MQMPDYPSFARAVTEKPGQPKSSFEALCTLASETVGAKLFTLMSFDFRKGVAQRIYSNMPEAYPVSGSKPVNTTDWARQVLHEKQTFVANDIEGIARVFDDYELIRSLGCESVMNIPVTIGGEVVGSINCLHEAQFYTPDKVTAAEVLKLPGALCLLLNERNSKAGDH